MMLKHLLSQKKAAILEQWRGLILNTYPDTSVFLKQEKDRFANPVGYTISLETETIYDGLLHGDNSDKFLASLDNIIRLRAVQDFSPSQAIAFIFLLKKAIRRELGGKVCEPELLEALLQFESKIDELVLLALDVYTECRDKVYEIRLNELRAESERSLRLLARASSVFEEPDKE